MELNLELFYNSTRLKNYKIINSSCFESYHYIIGEKKGWFSSKKQAIVQATVFKKKHNDYFTEFHTFVLENYDNQCAVRFWIPMFNDFFKFFKPNFPANILNKYPHLKIMANPYEFGPRREINEFGAELCLFVDLIFFGPRDDDYIYHFDDNARFVFSTSPIVGDTLTQKQADDIMQAHDFIKKAIEEYDSFKRSRLFHLLKSKSQEPLSFKDFCNSLSIFTIFRLCKLCYSLYSGFSSNDNDFGFGDSSTDCYLSDLNDNDMAELICGDYSEPENGDISFTGSGDKYTDNAYNQSQYDKWMDIYQEKLSKGDTSGAQAALATAKDHLHRIKN